MVLWQVSMPRIYQHLMAYPILRLGLGQSHGGRGQMLPLTFPQTPSIHEFNACFAPLPYFLISLLSIKKQIFLLRRDKFYILLVAFLGVTRDHFFRMVSLNILLTL